MPRSVWRLFLDGAVTSVAVVVVVALIVAALFTSAAVAALVFWVDAKERQAERSGALQEGQGAKRSV